jgi:hypothetical protein
MELLEQVSTCVIAIFTTSRELSSTARTAHHWEWTKE